jgi:hypothetical protein
MPEQEIADFREEEVLLEVASTFASRERNKLLEILSSGSGNHLRAQKILYQRAIRSLETKGLVQFSSDAVLGLVDSATKWYVAATNEGRRVAEEMAERRLAPADDAGEVRAG